MASLLPYLKKMNELFAAYAAKVATLPAYTMELGSNEEKTIEYNRFYEAHVDATNFLEEFRDDAYKHIKESMKTGGYGEDETRTKLTHQLDAIVYDEHQRVKNLIDNLPFKKVPARGGQ